MSTNVERMKAQKELPEVRKVKTDPENLHISRDEFIAKRRKQKEMEARLAIEREKIEKEMEEEPIKVKKVKKVMPEIQEEV